MSLLEDTTNQSKSQEKSSQPKRSEGESMLYGNIRNFSKENQENQRAIMALCNLVK